MVFENVLINYFSFSLKKLGCKNFQNFFVLIKNFFSIFLQKKTKIFEIVIIFFASTKLLNYFSFNLKKLSYTNG